MLRVLLVNYSFAHMWLKSFYTNFNVRLIKTFNIKSISVNDYKDERQQLTSRKLLNPFSMGIMILQSLNLSFFMPNSCFVSTHFFS